MIEIQKVWYSGKLKIKCKLLTEEVLWHQKFKREVIYFCPMEEAVAFLLTRYNQDFVEIIKSFPYYERFFYQIIVNRFKRLSIWCVRKVYQEEIMMKCEQSGITINPLEEKNADH